MGKINGVEHPSHYNRDGAIECIEEMVLIFGKQETAAFCKLNAWKYRYRAGEKPGEEAMKDLAKSDYYIKMYKELMNGSINNNCITYNSPYNINAIPTETTVALNKRQD